MNQMQLDRINELARKQKTVGLTPEETEEQACLRMEYISAIRRNMRGQLDKIDIVEADGSITNLGEKYGHRENKKSH